MYPAPVVIEIKLGFLAGDQNNADSVCLRDIRVGAGRHAGPIEDARDAAFTKAFPLTGPVTPWPSAALASALLITVHDVAFPAECPDGEGAGVVADPLPHAAVSTPITAATPVIAVPYRLHRICDLPLPRQGGCPAPPGMCKHWRLPTPHSLWLTNWATANTHKLVRQPALREAAVIP